MWGVWWPVAGTAGGLLLLASPGVRSISPEGSPKMGRSGPPTCHPADAPWRRRRGTARCRENTLAIGYNMRRSSRGCESSGTLTIRQPICRILGEQGGPAGFDDEGERFLGTTERAELDAWLEAADEVLGDIPAHADEDGPTTSEPPLGKLWATINKERDLLLEIRVGKIFGSDFVSLTDHEPSTGIYSPSVLIPANKLHRVSRELHNLHRYLGGWHS